MPHAELILAEHRTIDWAALWEEAVRKDEFVLEPSGASVSPAGWAALNDAVKGPDLHQHFLARVEPLIRIGYYDSAVREASILLENSMRARLASDEHGQQLVASYMRARSGLNEEFTLHLKAELRMAFKFIRNEFAHNIVTIDEARCQTMLRRLSAIYEMLDMTDAAHANPADTAT